MKSLILEKIKIRVNVISNYKLHSFIADEDGSFKVNMPKNSLYGIQLTYLGEDAVQYKLYVDGQPVITRRDGSEAYGTFCLTTNDICDRFDGPYRQSGAESLYQFLGGTTAIKLKVFPTFLVETKKATDRGGTNEVEGNQPFRPAQVDYKVDLATEYDEWEEYEFTIEEEGLFNLI